MTRVLLVIAALVAAFLAGATAYRRARIDARLAELDDIDWLRDFAEMRHPVTFHIATPGQAYFANPDFYHPSQRRN